MAAMLMEHVQASLAAVFCCHRASWHECAELALSVLCLCNAPSGNALNSAVFNATVNGGGLPPPCTGAAAVSTACLARTLSAPPDMYGPSSGPINSQEQQNSALALGLGLGLGLPLVGMLLVGGLLLGQRRHAQVVAPKASPAMPQGEMMQQGTTQLASPTALAAGVHPGANAAWHQLPSPAVLAAQQYYGQVGFDQNSGMASQSTAGQGYHRSSSGAHAGRFSPGAEAGHAPIAAPPVIAMFNPYNPPPTPGVPSMTPRASPTMGVLGLPPASPRADRQLRQQLAASALLASAAMAQRNQNLTATNMPLSPNMAVSPGPLRLSPDMRHSAMIGVGMPSPFSPGTSGAPVPTSSQTGARLPPLPSGYADMARSTSQGDIQALQQPALGALGTRSSLPSPQGLTSQAQPLHFSAPHAGPAQQASGGSVHASRTSPQQQLLEQAASAGAADLRAAEAPRTLSAGQQHGLQQAGSALPQAAYSVAVQAAAPSTTLPDPGLLAASNLRPSLYIRVPDMPSAAPGMQP